MVGFWALVVGILGLGLGFLWVCVVSLLLGFCFFACLSGFGWERWFDEFGFGFDGSV